MTAPHRWCGGFQYKCHLQMAVLDSKRQVIQLAGAEAPRKQADGVRSNNHKGRDETSEINHRNRGSKA